MFGLLERIADKSNCEGAAVMDHPGLREVVFMLTGDDA